MKIESFSLLTDENIHPEFIYFLREKGFYVYDVKESKLMGTTDEVLMDIAYNENRIIITQDKDFGKLVYSSGKKFLGIVYLRPGHLTSLFHIDSFLDILKSDFDLQPPFILVASKLNETVKIRLRNAITQ